MKKREERITLLVWIGLDQIWSERCAKPKREWQKAISVRFILYRVLISDFNLNISTNIYFFFQVFRYLLLGNNTRLPVILYNHKVKRILYYFLI